MRMILSFFMGMTVASAQIYHTLIPMDEIIQKKKGATVKILTTYVDESGKEHRSHGSGFLYGKDGYLITNDHVLRDFFRSRNSTLLISHHDERYPYSEVEVIKCSDERRIDICLLKVKRKKGREFIPAEKHAITPGLQVATVGNCDGDFNVKQGKVVKEWENVYEYINQVKNYNRRVIKQQNFDVRTVQVDKTMICPGDSGGPVFGSNGELIAVVAELVPISNNGRTSYVENMISGSEVFDFFQKYKNMRPVPIMGNRIRSDEKDTLELIHEDELLREGLKRQIDGAVNP